MYYSCVDQSSSSLYKTFAPIVIFAFNRPDKIQSCLKSLEKNVEFEKSEVTIFQDGPVNSFESKRYRETTKFLQEYANNKNIKFIKFDNNKGLQKSIIEGINYIFKTNSRIIVVEDDLIVSPYFLHFCNSYLEIYESEKEVSSIHGYSYPIKFNSKVPYFLAGADCWGWATWKDRWELFEQDAKVLLQQIKINKCAYSFDMKGSVGFSNMLYRQSEGKLNSWAIRWHASMFLQNKMTLFPAKSHVLNTGADGSGTNLKINEKFSTFLSTERSEIRYQKPKISKKAEKAMIKYYRKINSYSILKVFVYRICAYFRVYGKLVFK